ncbi:hypothetical protein P691DRAFT_390458 [Macrolepiota fuliginosa MF-IS2]|uniref:Uncharacterized protein n=1 Tax=Macrolepiota fuliginosa MF-IS2 TaxID=1400762 RepID=A0A9P6BZL4_9AGAR|nr:hypothetical protein P691DRAFT_390458 [Macrolepiota fuliginosa MF-IS2]
MVKITRFETSDVRFPTSLTGDGTGAMFVSPLLLTAISRGVGSRPFVMSGTRIATIPLPTPPSSLRIRRSRGME